MANYVCFLVVSFCLSGFVEPCALPFWWIQQYDFPPSFLQSIQPKTTYKYRETFASSDPNNFLHVKEYSEYTWWENGSPDAPKTVNDLPVNRKLNPNFGDVGVFLKPTMGGKEQFPVSRTGDSSLKEGEMMIPQTSTTGVTDGVTQTPVRSDLERNEKEVVKNTNENSESVESNGVDNEGESSVRSPTEVNPGGRDVIGNLFNWGEILNETEPCHVSETDIHSLRSMVEKMFSFPRDHVLHPDTKEKAREDILKKFRDFGLQVWTQNFSTPFMQKQDGEETTQEGVNLIGVIPGAHRGQLDDGIVLVGAHYDTVSNSNGVDDNGSGLAVLLEVARAMTQARCKFNNTLMFVAFDLEEQGAMGSNYFVDHYLIPEELKRARAHFQGAFILDGIMNYNEAPNTQDLPLDYAQSLPGLQEFVNNTGNRGNFLAMISRNNVDSHLTKQLMEAWQNLGDNQYKLYNLAVDMGNDIPAPSVIQNHVNFLTSDHATFWYHNSTSHFPETLNAVLLTDTGPYRGQMKECYHNKCDDLTVLSPEKLQFAKKTADALTATLVELTEATSQGHYLEISWMMMLILTCKIFF